MWPVLNKSRLHTRQEHTHFLLLSEVLVCCFVPISWITAGSKLFLQRLLFSHLIIVLLFKEPFIPKGCEPAGNLVMAIQRPEWRRSRVLWNEPLCGQFVLLVPRAASPDSCSVLVCDFQSVCRQVIPLGCVSHSAPPESEIVAHSFKPSCSPSSIFLVSVLIVS